MEGVRPSESNARKAVREFLDEEGLNGESFDLTEDGDEGWVFWVQSEDTTSYVHHDLKIEWYGTSVDYTSRSGAKRG